MLHDGRAEDEYLSLRGHESKTRTAEILQNAREVRALFLREGHDAPWTTEKVVGLQTRKEVVNETRIREEDETTDEEPR